MGHERGMSARLASNVRARHEIEQSAGHLFDPEAILVHGAEFVLGRRITLACRQPVETEGALVVKFASSEI